MGLRESFSEMDTEVKILLVVVMIPVVLVVGFALLVIFAAIIGTFVLGLGGEVDAVAPQATFSIQATGGGVEVVHDGGDAVAADQLVVAVNGNGRSWASLDADVSASGTVGTGESVTITGVSSGDSIAVRWVPPDGGAPTTLASYEVP